MDARLWLEAVRFALAQQRLPRHYAERLLGELSDHGQDFMENHMSTDARDLHGVFHALGSPAEIAATAKAEWRRQKFSLRHPFVTFAVFPLVGVPLLSAAAVMSFVLATEVIGWITGRESIGETFPTWANACLPILGLAMIVGPVAIAAAFFCRLAYKSAVSWRWPLVACCLIAVLASMVFADVILPGTGNRGVLHGSRAVPEIEGKSMLCLGIGFRGKPSNCQILQLLVPLSIYGWATWRQIRQRRQWVTA